MATNTTAEAPAAADATNQIIIDLGKHRRKRVKALRRGGGPLVAEVNAAIAELKAAGTIGASSQTVVVIVRQKASRKGALKNLVPGF